MDRKEIVKALSEHFGVKAEYMGVPSFAYQIKTEAETYTIDKSGKITNAEGIELELEAILNPVVEIREQEERNVIEETIEIEPQIASADISVPMEGHT